jgi:hypothetical protein
MPVTPVPQVGLRATIRAVTAQPSTTPSDGDRRPCVCKGCTGTMAYSGSARVPGTGAPARMSDGTLRTVGTVRPMWICDQNPAHMQTDHA